MGSKQWYAVAIGIVATLVACSPLRKQATERAAPVSLEQQAWDAIARGASVVDVRTEEEFGQGHLPGAVNIPYDQITARLSELPQERNTQIVLYCRSGRRSGIAKTALEGQGFTNVMNAGGYEALMQAQPRQGP
jgi:phage shock protein E